MEDLKALDLITHDLKIANKHWESPDACSFSFEIPEDKRQKYNYTPGQFVTLRLNIHGEEIRRSYSLCSTPGVDTDFKITVKRVQGGKASNHLLDHVQQGTQLRVTQPAGIFYQPKKNLSAKSFCFVAGGSGITPVFSIIKSLLHGENKPPVHLIFCNRNEKSVIYPKEISGLQKQFANFSVQYIFSQPEKSISAPNHKGRLDSSFLESHLSPDNPSFSNASLKKAPLKKDSHFYLCGPDGMMETVQVFLAKNGISNENVHRESFGGPAEPLSPNSETSEAKETKPTTESSTQPITEPSSSKTKVYDTVIGDLPSAPQTPETIIALLNGETLEAPYVEGQSILESLIQHGHSPPYSCMDGACMACMAKVEDGCVYQDDPGILTEDNIKRS